MDTFYKDQKLIHTQALFQALRCLSSLDFETKTKGMVYLREESKSSEIVRQKLRDLIYDDDGCIRILAAESLSLTQSYPSDAIPLLEAVLEVGMQMGISDKIEPWLRTCLGALYNYEEAAFPTERITWQYLYAQTNENLILYAIRLISHFAKLSNPSWTILCLLCRHQNSKIREYARELMKSEEFNSYCKQ